MLEYLYPKTIEQKLSAITDKYNEFMHKKREIYEIYRRLLTYFEKPETLAETDEYYAITHINGLIKSKITDLTNALDSARRSYEKNLAIRNIYSMSEEEQTEVVRSLLEKSTLEESKQQKLLENFKALTGKILQEQDKIMEMGEDSITQNFYPTRAYQKIIEYFRKKYYNKSKDRFKPDEERAFENIKNKLRILLKSAAEAAAAEAAAAEAAASEAAAAEAAAAEAAAAEAAASEAAAAEAAAAEAAASEAAASEAAASEAAAAGGKFRKKSRRNLRKKSRRNLCKKSRRNLRKKSRRKKSIRSH